MLSKAREKIRENKIQSQLADYLLPILHYALIGIEFTFSYNLIVDT